jgi:hypothetical protein
MIHRLKLVAPVRARARSLQPQHRRDCRRFSRCGEDGRPHLDKSRPIARERVTIAILPSSTTISIFLRVLAPHRQPLGVAAPILANKGPTYCFDRSQTRPDSKRGAAVASTQPRRRGRQLRFTPTRSRGVVTDKRRAGRVFATRCLTTVHHDRTAHMQGLASGAVWCRRLPHQHFCNRLHRRHRISKMFIWFSTTILLDEAAGAHGAHRAVGSERPMVRHLRPAGSQVAAFFWSVGGCFVFAQRRRGGPHPHRRIDPLRGTAALVRVQDQIQSRSATRSDK